jgi:hypothetical protein
MSAALKQKASEPTPTPFPSAERAALGHAIARAADANARRKALETAAQAAGADVLKAIAAAEAAEEGIQEAQAGATRHLIDKARGVSGPVPLTVREARAAAIAAQDDLDEARQNREALRAELDRGDNGLAALLVSDAAKKVVQAEMAGRGAALAAHVERLQREIVEVGSSLRWLVNAGAFPMEHGRPSDPGIRHAVDRLNSAPTAWEITGICGIESFAHPIGAQKMQAAFEALLRDANAVLPG